MPQIWVDRDNYRNVKISEMELPPLQDGQVRVAVDRYGLTANNISYAVSGDSIGYWNYFPFHSEGGTRWGRVPVWGLADVVESEHAGIAVGERLYGFFPMQTELVMEPSDVLEATFVDATAHRRDLPEFYNRYHRTQAEPAALKALENERCLLFPLYLTGFILADYLQDNAFFEANQVLIGSVSSKTGLALAAFLKSHAGFEGRVVGLTSPGNRAFVESLGDCDQVVAYGAEEEIDTGRDSVYVDMSGNGALRATLHNHLSDNMVRSLSVGATHWDSARRKQALPGAKPEFFFAPAHIAKREAVWGPGELFRRAYAAGAELAARTSQQLVIETVRGPEAARDIWLAMLDNAVSPRRGIMVSLGG